ncbi:hypothetical protein LTR53_003500 [Teratosphaeriaceae sp. CCFEE 6253]|nr:hypothetical protein LTR53_003500 [Teratosphaeriaceae sp. CCFEE 6253]
MASPRFHHNSNADGRKQQQQHGQRASGKSAQRTAMSKIAHASHSDSLGSGGETDEDAEEGDSSDGEGSDEAASQPDAFALPGAESLQEKGSQRLAGLEAGDMFMDEDMQAVAGAQASDDENDGYAGVDDVSDDEDDVDDRSVMRAVEQDLRNEFEQAEQRRNADSLSTGMNTMLLQTSDALAQSLGLAVGGATSESWPNNGFNVNLDDDPFVGLQFDDSLYQEMYADAERALGISADPAEERARQTSEDSAATKKRVRFLEPQETLSRSSSTASSVDPDDMYPDLFDAQDDPALRQQFGLDVDLDASFRADFSDAGSCYDFDGDEERMALAIDDESSDSDEDASSFAETENEGDTTDEETEEETIVRVQAMQRRADQARASAPSTPILVSRHTSPRSRASDSPATPRTGKGPRLGKFTIDKTKATFSSDASGKGIKVLPPQNPAEKDRAFWDRVKTVNGSSSGATRSAAYYRMRHSATKNMPQRPFTAQCTLGSMFNGNLDIIRNNDTAGIAGDLFPGLVPNYGSFTGIVNEASDQESEQLNIQDFVDLDDEESDVEEPASASSSTMLSQGASSRSSFSSAQARHNDSLLDHLDQHRGLVGSFRNNQSFAKHASSLALHPSKRASTLESNALQKGRRGAANTPITPARKKRVSQDLSLTGAGVKKTVSSPLAGRRPRSRGGSLSGGMNQTLGPSLM